MTTRTYPYQAWVLMPSFKPVEVTIERHSCFSADNWVESSRGKYYQLSDIHDSEAEAIKSGWSRIADQKAALEKKMAGILKKEAALRKAAQ